MFNARYFWYNVKKMLRQSFTDFIFATNTDGSGKAASYVRALDMLGPILTKHYPHPIVSGSMWHGFTLSELKAIHEWLCAEARKGSANAKALGFESPSYLANNFCSAAVKAYGEFMAAEAFEDEIVAKVSGETSGKSVAQKAETLIETTAKTELEAHLDLTKKEGVDKLAAVKVRVNQDIFRKIVLMNYSNKCCVTGLDVPAVLQASHISSWKEDAANRLNPENGLCLSATYHEAFDAHLISFDEDYRLIVSKDVKGHYTSAAAKSYFIDREGEKIIMPTKYLPSQTLLAKHRELLAC